MNTEGNERLVGIVMGPTGAGKSSVIKQFSIGEEPRVSASWESETIQTIGFKCNINGKMMTLYDTPGLGDSGCRDQRFMDELLSVMQQRAGGIHKLIYCRAVTEQRYDQFMRSCLNLVTTLFGGRERIFKGFLDIILTKADETVRSYWEQGMSQQKLEELQAFILRDYQIFVNVYTMGNGNVRSFTQSIKNINSNNTFQSSFMSQVKTLETNLKENILKAGKLQEEATAAKKQIDSILNKQNTLQAMLKEKNLSEQKMTQVIEQLKQSQNDLRVSMKSQKENDAKMLELHKRNAQNENEVMKARWKETQRTNAELQRQLDEQRNSSDDGGCIIL